ncbi:MAG: hypothetical protein M9962_08670 [Oligoflexia bacterium]|nr:hypothetical protein [Oligoflexia bacterium]
MLEQNQKTNLPRGWQKDLVNEDLARFLVTHYVHVCGDRTLEELKKYFQNTPEIEGIVDDALASMEETGLVSIKNGFIKVNRAARDVNDDPVSLARFLPRLMKLASERVLENAKTGEHKKKKEFVRFFAICDDAETAAEARAIYSEYVAKMRALIEKTEKENRRSENVRLVGVVGCSLVPEDFV